MGRGGGIASRATAISGVRTSAPRQRAECGERSGAASAAEHNLAALLQDTVVQARRVLDGDVAYLALPDPDGSLSVHVTDGSLGPRLRGLRLPVHSGLAGRVVDRAEPVQSVDYVHDVGLAHLDGIIRWRSMRGCVPSPALRCDCGVRSPGC